MFAKHTFRRCYARQRIIKDLQMWISQSLIGRYSSPCIANGLHAPQGLIDVINCGCKAERNAGSTERSCSCHKNNMLCIVYCACSAVDGCCNPFTMREDGDDDQQAEYESEEELVDNKKRGCYPLMKLTLKMISFT